MAEKDQQDASEVPQQDIATESSPSSFKDAQNIIGFLLAGFGGILTFLGLRSDEVAAVLRNDSLQASLIALILLIAVLAAILSIVVPNTKSVPLLHILAIFLTVLSLGALIIFMIPIREHRWPSLIICGTLLVIALVAWRIVPNDWEAREGKNYRSAPRQLTLILISVMLFACSTYGAMRLEASSQSSSGVQVGAQLAKSPDGMTLTLHVTGTKVTYNGYVSIAVVGLPNGIPLAADCSQILTQANSAACTEDPCYYLRPECEIIYGETVAPNADGAIDETLSDSFVPGNFQDLYIQTVICSDVGTCETVRDQGSRIDIHLGTFPPYGTKEIR